MGTHNKKEIYVTTATSVKKNKSSIIYHWQQYIVNQIQYSIRGIGYIYYLFIKYNTILLIK